jgi:hypothetical protein
VKEMIDLEFDAWVAYGVDKGFCTFPLCETHDGVPVTSAEMDEFDEFGEMCVPVLRLWK